MCIYTMYAYVVLYVTLTLSATIHIVTDGQTDRRHTMPTADRTPMILRDSQYMVG